MQRFARVDVAKAGDDTLIEQRHFHGDALAASALPPAPRRRRTSRAAPGPSPRTPGERRRTIAEQVHQAKTPRVVERDGHAVRQREHNMIVAIAGGFGGRRPAFRAAIDPERSRHAEVHQQCLAGVERHQQILTAAIDRTDPAAFEPRRKSPWKRPAQSCVSAARARSVRRASPARAAGGPPRPRAIRASAHHATRRRPDHSHRTISAASSSTWGRPKGGRDEVKLPTQPRRYRRGNADESLDTGRTVAGRARRDVRRSLEPEPDLHLHLPRGLVGVRDPEARRRAATTGAGNQVSVGADGQVGRGHGVVRIDELVLSCCVPVMRALLKALKTSARS